MFQSNEHKLISPRPTLFFFFLELPVHRVAHMSRPLKWENQILILCVRAFQRAEGRRVSTWSGENIVARPTEPTASRRKETGRATSKKATSNAAGEFRANGKTIKHDMCRRMRWLKSSAHWAWGSKCVTIATASLRQAFQWRLGWTWTSWASRGRV